MMLLLMRDGTLTPGVHCCRGGRVAAAACRGIVRVLVYWWPRGERVAIAAAVSVPWRCRGSGGATPARRRCWGGRGAAGVLRCWQGGGGALAGRQWRGGMTEASGVPLPGGGPSFRQRGRGHIRASTTGHHGDVGTNTTTLDDRNGGQFAVCGDDTRR